MFRDVIFCLREAVLSLRKKKPWLLKHSSECFENPPCKCNNPGQEIQCEDCPHLEACLSSFKLHQGYVNYD